MDTLSPSRTEASSWAAAPPPSHGTPHTAVSSLHPARIERAIEAALEPLSDRTPPRLRASVRHALFPAGARVRPRLCLAVAAACGDPEPALADAAAASIEMIHCASLVHDDLPCFDGADMRRGQPSVHRAFGESLAVLAGDELIVLSFEHLSRVGAAAPRKLSRMISLLARGTGAPYGIIAGQAWEAEPEIDSRSYRRAKTGALFEAAAALGAAAAGAPFRPWAAAFSHVGEAFQIADDIIDMGDDPVRAGKPVGKDAALGRPNAVLELGLAEARRLFDRLVREAAGALPPCADPEPVRRWLHQAHQRTRAAL